MDKLIKELEGATEGSRELDLAILAEVVHPDAASAHGPKPAFTTSLEAALTLVPEGWNITIEIASFQNAAWLRKDGETIKSDYGTKRSPALVVCIVALKARNNE